LPTLARACIERGYANLEWAVGVPGTVGGAVIGNAGAHGGDVARDLASATILDADGNTREWANAELEFGYRTSRFKISDLKFQILNFRPVVLAATFGLRQSTRQELEARAAEYTERRKRSQPPGATMGSMFKNPPGDYAGRLIEAAGLKGHRIGQAQISPLHANFFINLGGATAAEMRVLIDLARDEVRARFGIELELEIELVGECQAWNANDR
jgi:UDP-N-acetylmuramate dehydrogenase